MEEVNVQGSSEEFGRGESAGRAGEPIAEPENAVYRQGHVRGSVRRRIVAGEVLGVVSPASRCLKCKDVALGFRAGCSCWPKGGWDDEVNKAGGYAMEYGASMLDAGSPEVGQFMTMDELQATDKPLVDCFTGVVVPLS